MMLTPTTSSAPDLLFRVPDWRTLVDGLRRPDFEALSDFSLITCTPRSFILSCRHPEHSKPVVLKFAEASADALNDSKCLPARLAAARSLRHPNLVEVYAEGTATTDQGNFHYSLMEHLDGGTIHHLAHETPDHLTVGGLIEMLRGVASAIDALHSCGVLHRDIKPGNILVDRRTGVAKLGDLGIARPFADLDDAGPEEAQGTPAFMAPEQITSNRYGPAVDVYALAITTYFLLTRHYPFEFSTPLQALYAHINDTPIPIVRRNRNWPIGLSKVLQRSLAKEPQERHESASRLVRDVAIELAAYTPYRLSTYLDGRFSSVEIPLPR